MGLHVTIGSHSRRGPFHAVYVGDSATEARAAEEKSVFPFILRLNNPPGVRKNNPNAAANAAALAASTPPEQPQESQDEQPPVRPRRK